MRIWRFINLPLTRRWKSLNCPRNCLLKLDEKGAISFYRIFILLIHVKMCYTLMATQNPPPVAT
jgi:hypothetical protein